MNAADILRQAPAEVEIGSAVGHKLLAKLYVVGQHPIVVPDFVVANKVRIT